MKPLTQLTFSGRVGETFVIHGGSPEPLQAVLTEVTAPAKSEPRPFSIVFAVPSGDSRIPQATYRIEHAEIPAFDLFLVPIGPDPERKHMLYEAVFN